LVHTKDDTASRQRLQTLGTLAAAVAHEFNNVLEPIILFTESAIGNLPPDSLARADLERVLASARRGKIVAQRILTFSETPDETALLPTDLRSVVTESVALYSALAPRALEIRSEIPAQVPLVRADAALAVNLVLNLCSNARQAMQGRPGILTVGLRSVPPEVELWVADTGDGIEQAAVERVFEAFFSTQSAGEGTGLGLYVVHEIAKSFGARIALDSRLGAGTTVRIFFPAITESA
jgi:two-component system cell cycle sensor histidine kinase/response regulator CckA